MLKRIGWALVAVGLVCLVLPGPGLLFLVLGIVVLLVGYVSNKDASRRP